MTISWVLGEVLPKSRFRFLRLDYPRLALGFRKKIADVRAHKLS